jgi:hypothetical protein
MTWAQEELGRRKKAYEAACRRWHAAREAGNIVREEDDRERRTGVNWRAVDGVGRAALAGFQLAKSELDHIAARVQREAGDDTCQECEETARLMGNTATADQLATLRPPEPDKRLPPERDEEMPF